MPVFDLTLLDGFRVSHDHQEICIPTRKAKYLLAYLAVSRAYKARRDTLALLLWEDATIEQARSSLRQTLSRLRKALSVGQDVLWADQDNIGLTPGAWQMDTAVLESKTGSNITTDPAAHLCEDDLVFGEFLKDLVCREPAIEQWSNNERCRFRELSLQLLSTNLTTAMREKNFSKAIQFALASLTHDPLRETVHRQLMQAYELQGDSGRALRHYKALREKLDKELAVPPETETVALFEQIRHGRRLPAVDAVGDAAVVEPSAQRIAHSTILSTTTTENLPREDWDDDVDDSTIFGRQQELELLDRWILGERSKLVVIQGMGGIGKTSCAMKFARQNQGAFDVVCWKSLRDAPSLESLLAELIPIMSDHTDSSTTLSRFRYWCKTWRCLIVLDNAESILQPCRHTGAYLPGYEAYGEFLRIAGCSNHISSVLLTSREKPAEVATLEGHTLGVRTLKLTGNLDIAESLHKAKGLDWRQDELCALCDRYGGNPLALKIVMTTVQELYDGDVAQFLADDVTVFNSIRQLLGQQFDRLSRQERAILFWLAINRDWTDFKTLVRDTLPLVSPHLLMESLDSLRRRSLIEVRKGEYRLQPVVQEFLLSVLIETIVNEIINQKPILLATHALLKTDSAHFTRTAQINLLVKPIVERLLTRFGNESESKRHIATFLDQLREVHLLRTGYAGGNLLNLLTHAGSDVIAYDFSRLTLRHVDLRNRTCHQAQFSNATFVDSAFTHAFGGVLMLRYSPDGQWLASSHTSLDVFVWRTADLQPVLKLPHADWVRAIQFSADGKTLATGTDDFQIMLWDIESGQQLERLNSAGGRVAAIEFTADDSLLLSATEDGCIRRFDLSSGQCVSKFETQSGQLWFIAASADSKQLMSGGEDGTLRVWNLDNNTLMHHLDGHTDRIVSGRISPTGKLIASGSHDKTVRLWDNSSGDCIAVFSGHRHWVHCIAFNQDGTLIASGSEDGQIRIWDVHSKQCVKVIDAHSQRVSTVAFSPNSDQLVSGGEDQSIRVWDCSSIAREANNNRRINGQCLNILQGFTQQIWSVKTSLDERHAVTSGDESSLRIWDLETGECIRMLSGHSHRVKSLCMSSDDQRIASASEDQTVRLWNRHSGVCTGVLRGHTKQVWDVEFSPDGRFLASASEDHCIRIWDVANGECVQTLRGHEHWVWDVTFSPDSALLASSSFDHTVKLWDWRSGECVQTLSAHTGPVMEASFNHDGTLLASTSLYDRSVIVWDCISGTTLFMLNDQASASVEFCPASLVSDTTELLAIGTRDGVVRLWDIRSNTVRQELLGHDTHYWISSVNFTRSGRRLLSSSGDQSVRVWDLETSSCVRVLQTQKPYHDCDIKNIGGLTDAQAANLQYLGATAA